MLRAHGHWTRSQETRTGIRHSTVSGWLQDIPPQADGVIRFALGFGGDPREALRIAGHDPNVYIAGEGPGYEPLPTEESGHAHFVKGLAELRAELGRPIPVSLDVEQAARMTVEQAEETLAVLRRQAEEGLF